MTAELAGWIGTVALLVAGAFVVREGCWQITKRGKP